MVYCKQGALKTSFLFALTKKDTTFNKFNLQ